MADSSSTPTDGNNPVSSVQATDKSDFLSSASTSPENSNIYGDFFQETSDGSLSIGTKARKSGIELTTDILGYVVPVFLIIVVVLSIHVYLRTREDSAFAENYSFLCPYFNYGVDAENKQCKTLTQLTNEYAGKTKELQTSIVSLLSEYIPIKISKNVIDASPEKRFILDTYANKIHPDDIIKQFDAVVKRAQNPANNNIECNGISISHGDIVSTQCSIFGGDIGDDDANKKLGSARIETLRFTDMLSNTTESHFILLNPPVSLSVEKTEGLPDVPAVFKTHTTIPVQLKYIPLNQKL